MTTVQVKAWLFFARQRSPALRWLSANLLREICTYFSDLFLPCIQDYSLRLYYLRTGSVTTVRLSHRFRPGCVFCQYRPDRVLCVGDIEPSVSVLSLSLYSYDLEQYPSTGFPRSFPGLIAWRDDCVYAFGGNACAPISAAELLLTSDDHWTALPPMKYSRVAFLPVRFKDKIMLISSTQGLLPVEAFSPASATYEVLSVTVSGCGNGTLAAVYGEEIVVIL